MRWESPSPWRELSEPRGRMMGHSSSIRVVLALSAVMNTVMLGQNTKPVDASSPASPALQTAIAVPATEDGNLSDTIDQNESHAWLLPGEDPENHLTSPFLKHLGEDQKAFWTAPLDLNRNDWKWFAPLAGFTSAMIASDSWISKQLPDTPSQLKRSKDVSDYAVYSMIGVSGASFLLGHLTRDDHLQETGLLSGEAAINSTAVAYFFKEITERPRPYQGNEHGSFFQGGDSFPSEHSAIAWSVASVWAHEYPGKVSQILAYGLASAVSVTRVTSKQHFASDVAIGSALGWYFGRQVYRAHHDPELGGTSWGSLLPESKGETARDPQNMGSPNVSLDSWVYPALERLQALGYVHSGYLGMRPWTRMECARLLEEASDNLPGDRQDSGAVQRLYDALAVEFEDETRRLDGAPNLGASLDSIYTRATQISGTPLRDGYHFGQTIINDDGRPYEQGFNNIAGFTAHAVAGPFYLSVQGEYQRAPAVASDPPSVLNATAAADGGVTPLPDGSSTINRFRLLDTSVGFTWRNVQVSFGKQSLWLGPGESGSLLLSNNAAPITMLRINDASPVTIPLLSRILGPLRMDFFVGQLSGQTWIYNPPASAGLSPGLNPQFLVGPNLSPQPFIHENKISFRPTPNLEFGMGVSAMFGGPGLPFNWHEFLASYYGHNANTAINPAKRFSSFDVTYRIPGLRKWLTLYNDSIVGDEISPIGSSRPMLNPGFYIPQFPKLENLELRVEGFKDSPGLGVMYIDRRFRSGYTNDGNLIGSWIGRQAFGGQSWLKYSLSAKSFLQLGYRHQQVDQFLVQGGHLNDFRVDGAFQLASGLTASGAIQYEQWHFPALRSTVQSDITASVQLTFHPAWRVHK